VERDWKQTFLSSSLLFSLGVTIYYAFWSLSAALGKELQSILLKSVITDVVDELVILCFIKIIEGIEIVSYAYFLRNVKNTKSFFI